MTETIIPAEYSSVLGHEDSTSFSKKKKKSSSPRKTYIKL
jgi:hypothetical protein